jgi:hypothetical protein
MACIIKRGIPSVRDVSLSRGESSDTSHYLVAVVRKKWKEVNDNSKT